MDRAFIVFLLGRTDWEDYNIRHLRPLRTDSEISSLDLGWSSSATHWLRDLGHISILLQASIPWVLKGKGDYTRWPMRAIPVVTVSVLNGVSMTPEKRMNPLGWLQWLSHMAGENKEGCSDLWHFWLASVTLYLPFPVILEVALELPKVGVRWALVSAPWFSHSTLSGWTVLGEGVPTCPVL